MGEMPKEVRATVFDLASFLLVGHERCVLRREDAERLYAHISAEPARVAAAVATERERTVWEFAGYLSACESLPPTRGEAYPWQEVARVFLATPAPAPVVSTTNSPAVSSSPTVATPPREPDDIVPGFTQALRGTCESIDERQRQLADRLSTPPREPDGAGDDFTAWLCREMPPGTVIGDPRWWAPRIAARARAAAAVPECVREAVEARVRIWGDLISVAETHDDTATADRLRSERDVMRAWLATAADAAGGAA